MTREWAILWGLLLLWAIGVFGPDAWQEWQDKRRKR